MLLPAVRARLAKLVKEARRLSKNGANADSAAILRELVSDLPLAALVANDDGRYVIANKAASELTGYSNRELRALSVWDLTPPNQRGDFELLWRAFLQQRQQNGEYPLAIKDGSVVKALYAACAHALPGLHLSLLTLDR